MLGIEEIMKVLPHRYPFLLVDRILEIEDEQADRRASRTSRSTSRSFRGISRGIRSCRGC